MLQQHLPFTVLKPIMEKTESIATVCLLQQHLPFTVLKQNIRYSVYTLDGVATALTVYGIETNSIKAGNNVSK